MTFDYCLQKARKALRADGSGLEFLMSRCFQIVVYGSVAAGTARAGSDVDLLCIGTPPRRRIGGRSELVWLDPRRRFSKAWLGCGLASHIAGNSIWIHGFDDWTSRVYCCAFYVERQRIELATMAMKVQTLRGRERDALLLRLRREMIWLAKFAAGEPMPSGEFELGDVQAAAAAAGVLLPPTFSLWLRTLALR